MLKGTFSISVKCLRSTLPEGKLFSSYAQETNAVREKKGLAPTLTMHNGVEMPMVGLGTWEALNPEQLKNALRHAFDCGYRLIDTAYFYGNEEIIGEVIEEYTKAKKLTRAEIFISTKVGLHEALRVNHPSYLLRLASLLVPSTGHHTEVHRRAAEEVPHALHRPAATSRPVPFKGLMHRTYVTVRFI